MGISLQQVQKLSQRLAMTPLMQQSLHLLQLPNAELEQLVLEEATQNPFLEIKGEIDDEAAEVDHQQPGGLDSAVLEGHPSEQDAVSAEDSTAGSFEQVDVNWDDLYDDNWTPPPARVAQPDPDEEEHDLEDFVAAPSSLFDNLRWQIRVMPAPERLRELAERLIGYLDEDGYLRVPLEEIAQESGCSLPELEEALRLVQSLDPPGIGARSLAECLEIQLRHRRVDDPLAYEIVRKYLPELQKKNIKKLAKQLGAEEERVRNLVNLISSLEPKPGYAYSTTPPAYIRPDVIVRRIDNDYYVFVDDGLLSDLRISPTYRRLLEDPDRLGNEEERKFAREKLKAAQWLVKNINRRKNTLLRVAQAIVDHQREFFDKGINYLKPLTLRQIAEEVGMHESTVARVTSGKYMDTPRGTFEMKYFFSRGLPSDSGEEASNRTVKQMIAELIENDDPNNPMSDQRIVELLKEKGINIARRTVAKYREQLGILPSRLRKKV
jgi:RNA polymerase sigma-54 factor